MLYVIALFAVAFADPAPVLLQPTDFNVTIRWPNRAGRCEIALARRPGLPEHDGWTARVRSSHLSAEVEGRARLIIRSGLRNEAQGMTGWLLKGLQNGEMPQWPGLLPDVLKLRSRMKPTDFEMIRHVLAFLRRNTTGHAFEISYRVQSGDAVHSERFSIFVPSETAPRGLLVGIYSLPPSSPLINLRGPRDIDRVLFTPVMVDMPEFGD